MKFTCDSCSAQYMLSDDKVGPNGVKVRCKKCGNVIVVRRSAEAPAAAPAPAAAAAAVAPAGGLDVELGQAFDSAFGDAPAPAGGGEADLGATQLMGADDQARIASPPAPASTEWYVAIGQAQVGPLPLAEVKRKWESGDVGPDSLVWRPGMGDWQPLSSVAELAGYLAPVARAEAKPSRPDPQPFRSEPQSAREKAATTPAPVAPAEVTWKPVGASALAALANEEIASRAAPAAKPAVSRAAPGGVKSLVEALPDGGGVDPTGAIPLSITGLDTTGEKKLERRSSVASRAEETRHKRSMTRAVLTTMVLVVAVVGGAATYVLSQMKKMSPAPAVVAVAPAAPAAAPAAPAPAPAPAATPAAPATPPPAQPVAAAAPAAAAPAAPTTEEPAAPARPAAKGGRERRLAKAEPPTAPHAKPSPPAHAAALAPAAPAPTPAPAPAAGRKKDSLLDFDSGDSALDDALGSGGGGASGRSVYVPPARAGGTALPDKLTPAQINESVAGRIDALRKCVSEQKARDPGASGVLKMKWVIGGDGIVRDAKAMPGDYAAGPFAGCITGVVKTIKFPRSATAGQEITFPFSF